MALTAPVFNPVAQPRTSQTFPLGGPAVDAEQYNTLDAAGVVTITAVTGKRIVLSQVHYSYSAAPTAGALTITDGGTTVFSVDVTAAGPGVVEFNPPRVFGLSAAVVVTLADPGGAIVSKVNVNAWVTA